MTPRRLLLVEDDPSDALFMKEAFAACGIPVDLETAESGKAALARLRALGPPALVILDWHLPGMGGDEVLSEIRRSPGLRLLPVIVLTSSQSRQDVRRAYELGANCFMTKPTGLDAIGEAACALAAFWLRQAVLPYADRH